MKMQNRILYFNLIFFTLFTISCTTDSTAASSPATPFLKGTPILTSTPTIIPALPVEEAQARLLDLLDNNNNCHPPCLWGITPGKSSFQDAQIILAPLSGLSYFVSLNPSGPGDISPRYTQGNFEIYTSVAFLTNSNSYIVNYISFNAEAHRLLAEGGYEDVYNSKFFGEKVSAYALPNILSGQGVPSSVMIATNGGPLTRGGTGGFDILLLYPDQGILINYTTQMDIIGTNVRGCPSNAHVEMELYPSRHSESFFELLKETYWGSMINSYEPLDAATSISVDEFYQIFSEPTDKCIETPISLWPTPEP